MTVESTNVESTSEAATGTRRDFLYIATGAAAAVGTLAALFPMIDQMEPDASALAAGGPVDFDVSKLQPGQQAVVRWRSRPIFIVNRPPAAVKMLQDPKLLERLSDANSSAPQQPPYADNWHRSIKPEYGLLVGICTHLGCIPMFYPGPQQQSAHGRLAGRLFLPVSRLQIRSGRSRVRRCAGSLQSAGSTLSLPQRHDRPDRRKSTGGRLGFLFNRPDLSGTNGNGPIAVERKGACGVVPSPCFTWARSRPCRSHRQACARVLHPSQFGGGSFVHHATVVAHMRSVGNLDGGANVLLHQQQGNPKLARARSPETRELQDRRNRAHLNLWTG